MATAGSFTTALQKPTGVVTETTSMFNRLRVSLCPLRLVGSIRGSRVNPVCPPSSFPPRLTRFQPFLVPLNLYFSFYLLYRGHSFNLYLPSTDESYYPLTLSIPCPLTPRLPLVLLLLVVFINPLTSILVLTLFLCFAISSSASYLCICVCLSPRYCSIYPSSSFFLHHPSNWEADVDSG